MVLTLTKLLSYNNLRQLWMSKYLMYWKIRVQLYYALSDGISTKGGRSPKPLGYFPSGAWEIWPCVRFSLVEKVGLRPSKRTNMSCCIVPNSGGCMTNWTIKPSKWAFTNSAHKFSTKAEAWRTLRFSKGRRPDWQVQFVIHPFRRIDLSLIVLSIHLPQL